MKQPSSTAGADARPMSGAAARWLVLVLVLVLCACAAQQSGETPASDPSVGAEQGLGAGDVTTSAPPPSAANASADSATPPAASQQGRRAPADPSKPVAGAAPGEPGYVAPASTSAAAHAPTAPEAAAAPAPSPAPPAGTPAASPSPLAAVPPAGSPTPGKPTAAVSGAAPVPSAAQANVAPPPKPSAAPQTTAPVVQAVPAAASPAPAAAARVIVDIRGIESDSGKVQAALFRTEAGFPDETKKAEQRKIVKITNRKVDLSFDNVSPGTFVVLVHHDENGNGQMERGMFGIPQEGWGATRDPAANFGPPSFDDARLTISAGETKRVVIKMRY